MYLIINSPRDRLRVRRHCSAWPRKFALTLPSQLAHFIRTLTLLMIEFLLIYGSTFYKSVVILYKLVYFPSSFYFLYSLAHSHQFHKKKREKSCALSVLSSIFLFHPKWYKSSSVVALASLFLVPLVLSSSFPMNALFGQTHRSWNQNSVFLFFRFCVFSLFLSLSLLFIGSILTTSDSVDDPEMAWKNKTQI